LGGGRGVRAFISLLGALAFAGSSAAYAQDDVKSFFQKMKELEVQQRELERGPGTAPDQPSGDQQKAAIRQRQEWLAWQGVYQGPLDGLSGPGTVAAIKDFQKKIDQREDGNLTEAQINILRDSAIQKSRTVAFAPLLDGITGIRIGIPHQILPIRNERHGGSSYMSRDGQVRLELRAFHTSEKINSIYTFMQTALAATAISYSSVRPDWFVISGELNGYKYYVRYHQRGTLLKGFSATYPSAFADFEIPLTVTSLTTEPFHLVPRSVISVTENNKGELTDFIAGSRTGQTSIAVRRESPASASPAPSNQAPGLSETSRARDVTSQPGQNRPDTNVIKDDGLSRKDRLSRLAAKSLKAPPTFYEYLVDKKDLPGQAADEPVLRVVFEERVFFDTALSNIRRDAESVLEVVAEALRNDPSDAVLFIAGHADSRGGDQYNLDLSIKRADSVATAAAIHALSGDFS
jgi:outer membrane protein OmpA-like peptidoglycan-associated protein/peptidoglycan hydrolase-like protein with peptidoglycan-binding domain